jgi:hypothetical protein
MCVPVGNATDEAAGITTLIVPVDALSVISFPASDNASVYPVACALID